MFRETYHFPEADLDDAALQYLDTQAARHGGVRVERKVIEGRHENLIQIDYDFPTELDALAFMPDAS